jgi:AhpD family alkylhydroperoxidase
MTLRELPLEEIAEPYRSVAERSIFMSGDALYYRTLMNVPWLVDFFYGGFYPDVFYGGEVPTRIKELARFRLAQLHVCGHCMRYDIAALRDHGVTEEEIRGVADFDNGPFSAADKAFLRLATLLSNAEPDGHVDEELWEELHAHWTDAQIIEFSFVMAVVTGLAKMMFALDLAEKDNACLVSIQSGDLASVGAAERGTVSAVATRGVS